MPQQQHKYFLFKAFVFCWSKRLCVCVFCMWLLPVLQPKNLIKKKMKERNKEGPLSLGQKICENMEIYGG